MAASRPCLEAVDVHRTYRVGKKEVPVLRGLDLRVQRGEVLSLCGPSGAGKTTLLYALAGLERPDRGEVLFEGESLYKGSASRLARRRNHDMGYLFQSFYLMPEFTALENVLLPAFIGGHDRQKAAIDVLERVGLGERLQHLPTELSGGEQQRVALARAMVNDPHVLFADEPTGNLDSVTGGEVMDLIFGMAREGGKALLIVTHDEVLAARADRMVHLVDGHIVE